MRPRQDEETTSPAGACQETCQGGGDWKGTNQGVHVLDESKVGSEQKRGGAIENISGELNPWAKDFVPEMLTKNNPPSPIDVMGHQKDEEEMELTNRSHQEITLASTDMTGCREGNGKKRMSST